MRKLTVEIEFDGQIDDEDQAKILAEIQANVTGVESVQVVPETATATVLLDALCGMLRRYPEKPGTYTPEGAIALDAIALAKDRTGCQCCTKK